MEGEADSEKITFCCRQSRGLNALFFCEDYIMNNQSLIIRGKSGEELIIFRPVEKSSARKLIPVSENIASTLTGAGVTAGMTALAGNGLFRATVNPSVLMTYTDGTISSIVTEGGKIVGHGGFQSVSPGSIFAPMLAFQLVSMITSQYYFNLLSKQLTDLSAAVNKIISYLEERDKVVITETRDRLDDIFIQMKCETTDDDVLTRIHKYIDDVSVISSLYKKLCEKELKKITKKTWQAFSESDFRKYWDVHLSSRQIVSYGYALEFVIRLRKNDKPENNAKKYLNLQSEYLERFKKYTVFQVKDKTFYLLTSSKEFIEETASFLTRISQKHSQDKREMWISEKERRAISQAEENTLNFLNEFFSGNAQLSNFNTHFKEETEKFFQTVSSDNALFFDAATGKYYLEEK